MSEPLRLEIPEAFNDLFVPKRYKVYYGGRGAAKSKTFAIVLLALGMAKKIGVLCARELQTSISDSVHSLLSQTINEYPEFEYWYEVKKQEIVGKNGTRISFKGLRHNISEIKSYEGLDICWVEEAQAVSDNSWETLIPTIRKNDSEIWISFNPKNPTDPTYSRFVLHADKDTFVRKVSWRDNPYFPNVLEKERLKLLETDPEAYAHVWDGEFDTRHSGSVYAKFIKQQQVKDETEYDRQIPIYTAWDLGFDDATAIIWFQLARGEIRVIDYYEANFEDPQHYCEQLYGRQIIVDERDLRTGRVVKWHFGDVINDRRDDYNYTACRHYVPHDAANKLLAAGGRSFVEQCREFGVIMEVIGASSQQDNEAALRNILPRTWFNGKYASDLIHALMNYHYEFDEERKVYSKLPVHDWSSHGCDAAELMARAYRDSGLSMRQIEMKIQDAEFYRKRRQFNVDHQDPYQIKPRKSK